MSAEKPATTPVEIVVCEKHGLRYNALTETGCVRCRKAAAARRTSAGGASLRNQLLLSLGLIAATGAGFFLAHQAVAARLTAGPTGDDSAFVSGMETDAEVMMVILSDPELLQEIETDPMLRRALDEGDTDTLRRFIDEHRGDVDALGSDDAVDESFTDDVEDDFSVDDG